MHRECERKIRNGCKVRVPNTFTSIFIAICFAINIFNFRCYTHINVTIIIDPVDDSISEIRKLLCIRCMIRVSERARSLGIFAIENVFFSFSINFCVAFISSTRFYSSYQQDFVVQISQAVDAECTLGHFFSDLPF